MQSLDVQSLDQLAYHINSLPQGPTCCSPPKKNSISAGLSTLQPGLPQKIPAKNVMPRRVSATIPAPNSLAEQ